MEKTVAELIAEVRKEAFVTGLMAAEKALLKLAWEIPDQITARPYYECASTVRQIYKPEEPPKVRKAGKDS